MNKERPKFKLHDAICDATGGKIYFVMVEPFQIQVPAKRSFWSNKIKIPARKKWVMHISDRDWQSIDHQLEHSWQIDCTDWIIVRRAVQKEDTK